MAVPYVRRLITGFPPRLPRVDPRSGHVGFVVDEVVLRQVFSEYFGFLCQSSFHQLLLTLIRGWHNRPISGLSTKWTQCHPTARNKDKLKLYESCKTASNNYTLTDCFPLTTQNMHLPITKNTALHVYILRHVSSQPMSIKASGI
jgi:hypothetical protein